jgi:hypothetical protein
LAGDVEIIRPEPRPEDERKDGATRAAMDVALDQARQGFEHQVGEQLQLMPDDGLPDDDGEGEAAGPGKKGRPPGARNKKTEEFVSFVRAIGGDPMIGLAKASAMDALTLAKALSAKPFDVWKLQQELRKALLPYFHAARPAELKVAGGGALAVAVFTGEGPRGDQEAEGRDAVEALMTIDGNQWVSEEPSGQSNDPQSNDPANPSSRSRG